jgi:hypothetical protein
MAKDGDVINERTYSANAPLFAGCPSAPLAHFCPGCGKVLQVPEHTDFSCWDCRAGYGWTWARSAQIPGLAGSFIPTIL